MIRHHVEQDAHVALMQGLHEYGEVVFGAEFGVEPRVIRDVVAVQAAGLGHQDRRAVAIADAEAFPDRARWRRRRGK